MRVYLDHNASAPLRPEARAAMLAALDVAGNPSSVHAEGRAARALVEAARAQVAAAAGCRPDEVIFTSGATEAAMVLAGWPGGVSAGPLAHAALTVHHDGGDGALAVPVADGETGIIPEPPVKDGALWRAGDLTGRALFLDAAQALGRVPFAFGWTGAEMAALSAHKIGGPRGVGALILREGVEIAPLSRGGGQESGRRSGTENVAGIAGFGAAAAAAVAEQAAGVWDGVAAVRDAMEAAIAAGAPDTIFVGKGGPRLANTSCIVSPGWKGETQVMALDLAGFAVSAGAACSSGRVRPSRVLQALGFDAGAAGSAIRVSLGPATTMEQALRLAEVFVAKRRAARLRAA